MDDGADAKPEELSRLHSSPQRERARQVGDPLAMALRVAVLRLDRSAPVANDLEEEPLETRHTIVDVRKRAAGAHLRQHPVAAVEMCQCVTVSALAPRKLGSLARCLGPAE